MPCCPGRQCCHFSVSIGDAFKIYLPDISLYFVQLVMTKVTSEQLWKSFSKMNTSCHRSRENSSILKLVETSLIAIAINAMLA